jgi:hypothetical protein
MLTKDIQENFPFLSVVTYGGNEFIGIIINQDSTVTSMYVYTDLRTPDEQKSFLELGETWWWESNRMIPINIFLKNDMDPFRYSIVTMNSKDVRVTLGPCVNLNELAVKRVKRKSIQLVKRPR